MSCTWQREVRKANSSSCKNHSKKYTDAIRFSAGETDKLVELLLEGYDHILNAEDNGANIVSVAAQRGHEATEQFLQSIPNYVVSVGHGNRRNLQVKCLPGCLASYSQLLLLLLRISLNCHLIIGDQKIRLLFTIVFGRINARNCTLRSGRTTKSARRNS